MTARVATYNIRKSVGLDWRRRPDRILKVLREIGADVVALQEVDKRFGSRVSTLPVEALAEAGWAPVDLDPASPGIGWFGNAILLGPRARLLSARGLELPALEPRGAAVAEVDVAGRRLRVVGMHLGLTARLRLRQAAFIIAELEARPGPPTVLMGDMNEWRRLAGALEVFARDHVLSPPHPTFHASRPVAALDRILVGEGLRLLACRAHHSVTARRASDHLPLWADLGFDHA